MQAQTLSDPLSSFNSLVQQYQEQAYMLACFLLGDETSAERATQAGVLAAYREWGRRRDEPFAGWLLGKVAQACRTEKNNHSSAALHGYDDRAGESLARLPFEQRLAVALVDALGLSWEEAARAANHPARRFYQLLAAARQKMVEMV